MNKNTLRKTIRVMSEVLDCIHDLPLKWQEEMAECDIDSLQTANVLEEIIDVLKEKMI